MVIRERQELMVIIEEHYCKRSEVGGRVDGSIANIAMRANLLHTLLHACMHRGLSRVNSCFVENE